MYSRKWNYNIPKHGNISCPNTRNNIIIKNCAPFTDCKSKIKNTYLDNAEEIYVVMSMCNLLKYSSNSSKTLGSS